MVFLVMLVRNGFLLWQLTFQCDPKTGSGAEGSMNTHASTWHWRYRGSRRKQGLKCAEPEISTRPFLPFIRGCKFVSGGLIHLPSISGPQRSSLVRNILNNAARTIINCLEAGVFEGNCGKCCLS